MTAITVQILKADLDADHHLARFRSSNKNAGAIVSFLGQVRSENSHVRALHLQHYPEFTEKRIYAIADDIVARFEVDSLLIIHRIGRIEPAAPIVLAAAAAAHRRAAFECVDCVMDYLKSEAPFWKQEDSSNGQRWVYPTSGDSADLQRWGENCTKETA
ncbi:MAG: molybdenum cofactor biosynthesis protein MoaE [Pseudomonadota bacterium]